MIDHISIGRLQPDRRSIIQFTTTPGYIVDKCIIFHMIKEEFQINADSDGLFLFDKCQKLQSCVIFTLATNTFQQNFIHRAYSLLTKRRRFGGWARDNIRQRQLSAHFYSVMQVNLWCVCIDEVSVQDYNNTKFYALNSGSFREPTTKRCNRFCVSIISVIRHE